MKPFFERRPLYRHHAICPNCKRLLDWSGLQFHGRLISLIADCRCGAHWRTIKNTPIDQLIRVARFNRRIEPEPVRHRLAGLDFYGAQYAEFEFIPPPLTGFDWPNRIGPPITTGEYLKLRWRKDKPKEKNMHFKNGREAREGDPVICLGYNSRVTVGRIHTLTPGVETCNCTVAEPVVGGINQLTCRTLKEMYHAEDAFSVIEKIECSKLPLPEVIPTPAEPPVK